MSGVYSAPTRLKTREQILQAVEDLTQTSTSPENLQAVQFLLDKGRIIHFPDLSYSWQYEAPYKYPIVGAVYITRTEDSIFSLPEKVETHWQHLGETGLLVNFNKLCAGFVILA